MTDKSRAALILETAASLIDGDRDKQHGDRHQNFRQTAELWSAYLQAEITAVDVAWLFILAKASRHVNGEFNIDNFTDACGYAALAGELGGAQAK